MSSEFFDSFNESLPEFERDFGETWYISSDPDTVFPAIAIHDLTFTHLSGAAGGPLAQANTSLDIRKYIFTKSAVKQGDIITVRGKRVRVFTTTEEGDDSVTLICGPLGQVISAR